MPHVLCVGCARISIVHVVVHFVARFVPQGRSMPHRSRNIVFQCEIGSGSQPGGYGVKTLYTSNMNDGTDPIALAKQLMAQPTYGESLGVEHAAIHVIAQRFDKLGIPYTLRQHKGRSYNIIAHVNKDRGTPSIVLNTHLDVVPPGNEEAWQHDPFQPVIVQEELIGRGACDAKGSAAAMVIAFEQLWRERHRLSGSVCLALVGGEETGGAGTIYEIDHGLRADAVIVGEPTQLVPHIAHKGRMTVEVSARGQAAHSSEPHLGENAIQRMGVLLPKLAAVHSQVSKKTHALLGSASSAITQIEGGVAVNVIPPHCTVRIDRRLLPGETPEDALQQYKEAISLTNMNG